MSDIWPWLSGRRLASQLHRFRAPQIQQTLDDTHTRIVAALGRWMESHDPPSMDCLSLAERRRQYGWPWLQFAVTLHPALYVYTVALMSHYTELDVRI